MVGVLQSFLVARRTFVVAPTTLVEVWSRSGDRSQSVEATLKSGGGCLKRDALQENRDSGEAWLIGFEELQRLHYTKNR